MPHRMPPKWIWPVELSGPDKYVEFRREFELSAVETATLKISADTNFAAWINGVIVGNGQFSDFPQAKTYSTIDITHALKPGKNVLAVLVHYCGVGHFSYIPGQAGLWFYMDCGDVEITSNSDTLCRKSPCYKNNTVKLTPQMGFTFDYDAAGEEAWQDIEYVCDDTWQEAAICENDAQPQPRPLPMLEFKPRVATSLIAQGLFKRENNPQATVAQLMQQDFLSARRSWELFDAIPKDIDPVSQGVTIKPETLGQADGAYIIYDLGAEQCGLIDIEFEAPAGAIVDIATGEHLDDMRVRSAIGSRNFASRYVTRDGLNKFTHFTNRYACRYVQLHISNISEPVKIIYAGIRPTDYPIEFRGEFNSADSLDKEIFETTRRTMHLCMHEHYEDCPWREQALYANDSRNQALAGYYAFGEYKFPATCFDLLRRSFSPDGYQELCAPMKFDFTIPSFTMAWYVAMGEYLLYSGDVAEIEKILPQIAEMADVYTAALVDDLLPSVQGERYWHFYDWADGLSGEDVNPTNGGLTYERFDGPMNFIYVMALQAIGKMADACGDKTLAESCQLQAEATKKAALQRFWDENQQAFKTYVGEKAKDHFAELTQSLALLCGLDNDQKATDLRQRLTQPDNGLVATTLSQSIYKFEALMQQPDIFGCKVFDTIQADWGKMLFAGATSFWETIRGSWDFDCAGSLCHGWSGIPAYFYGAYALGVKPLENGFKTFSVSPAVNTFDKISGIVPTPHGNIEISWQRFDDKFKGHLKHPAAIKPVLPQEQVNSWDITSF